MFYFIVPKKWQWVVILIANVLFYIASGIKYLIYIIFVSFIAYWIALGIEKVNVLSAKTMKAVEDSETKKEVKSGNLYIKLHFTRLSGRYSVLERPLSEMKRSFVPQSSFKSMARAKAGTNAPLTGFQTVDYCNQAEQWIVLLMSIQ